jgi:creatinine amidohydrolase/Fe(II)-dependent formamide hydrolase-like protein
MPLQRLVLQVSMFVSLVVALMCGARAAHAGAIEIERMTWIEVRDAVAHGATTAIVPTGGTEQNGAHMVLGKHNFIVAEAARRIARELGDTLVAPVLAYVPEGDIATRAGHMAYAGTLSLPEPVFEAVIEAAAQSLGAHGFKTIVLLGDSGGNQGPQARLAERLTKAWSGDGIVVLNAAAYYAEGEAHSWLESIGVPAAEIGTHAGVRDTSELMAVFPAGVNLDHATAGADGATGDARLASRERGERLLSLKVEAAVAEIRAARERERASTEARSPGLLPWLYRLIAG